MMGRLESSKVNANCKLVRLFGLEPSQVVSMVVDIQTNSLSVVRFEIVPTAEQMKEIGKIIGGITDGE